MRAITVEGAIGIAPARGWSSGYRSGSHRTEISATNGCKKYAEKLPQKMLLLGIASLVFAWKLSLRLRETAQE